MERQKARSQQRNGLGIALVGRLAHIRQILSLLYSSFSFSRKTFRRRVLPKIVGVSHTMHINNHHPTHIHSTRILSIRIVSIRIPPIRIHSMRIHSSGMHQQEWQCM